MADTVRTLAQLQTLLADNNSKDISEQDLRDFLVSVFMPVGSIVAWHKSMTGTPSLPENWVECNGQTLSDSDSPYDGQVIPNLNGDGAGAASPGQSGAEQMFLRGGTTSGTGQTDAMQGHKHTGNTGTLPANPAEDKTSYYNSYASSENPSWHAYTWQASPTTSTLTISGPSSDGVNGTPRTADETRPKNMTVVWIMKIK